MFRLPPKRASLFVLPLCIAMVTTFTAEIASGQTWATSLFKETKHNFGVVARAAKTKHVFEFTNTTGGTIHISGARTSCNCTTPRVLTPTVEPGHIGKIETEFNTRGFKGQHGANVTVSFSSPSYTEVQLRVDGFIREDVVIDPGEINFGSLVAGEKIVKSVIINYVGKPNWALDSVYSNNPNLKTELIQLKREGSIVQYQLNVSLDEKCPLGYIKEELRLVTNEPNKTVPLMINGLLNSPIQVPSVVDLGRVKSGATINKVVIVKAHRAFTVVGVENADSRIVVDQPSESKKTHLLRLTFNANSEGILSDEVILRTDDPSMPEARIKITGDVSSDAK